jgi:hypothetical protein
MWPKHAVDQYATKLHPLNQSAFAGLVIYFMYGNELFEFHKMRKISDWLRNYQLHRTLSFIYSALPLIHVLKERNQVLSTDRIAKQALS